MKQFLRVTRVVMSLLFASAVLGIEPGCVSPKKTDVAKKTADDDEWVTLPPLLGSNIPRRVRRSELYKQQGSSPVDNVSGEAVMSNVRPQGPPPSAGGNN